MDNSADDSGTFSASQAYTANDIEKLKFQVQEYENLEFALNQQIQDRRRRYKESIENLKKQIVDEQEKYEKILEDQDFEQQSEFQNLKKDLDFQQVDMQRMVSTGADMQILTDLHKTISKIRKELEYTKIQSQLNSNENTIICNSIRQLKRETQIASQAETQKTALKVMLKNAEEEYQNKKDDLKFLRNKYSTILSELENSINVQKQCYEFSKQKIIREMQKRDKFFGKHINIIQNTINSEVHQTEFEIACVDDQYRMMQDIKREKAKRWNILLNGFTRDIQKMQQSLEMATQNDNQDDSDMQSSIVKSTEIGRETDDLKKTEQKLQSELDYTNRSIQKSMAILKQVERDEYKRQFKKLSKSLYV